MNEERLKLENPTLDQVLKIFVFEKIRVKIKDRIVYDENGKTKDVLCNVLYIGVSSKLFNYTTKEEILAHFDEDETPDELVPFKKYYVNLIIPVYDERITEIVLLGKKKEEDK